MTVIGSFVTDQDYRDMQEERTLTLTVWGWRRVFEALEATHDQGYRAIGAAFIKPLLDIPVKTADFFGRMGA